MADDPPEKATDMTAQLNDDGRLAAELDRTHVFHSWSAQAHLDPLVIQAAHGCEVQTADGTTYLDFSSQLVNVNIGHQHPRVIDAIVEQAQQLATVAPSHAVLPRGRAARAILAHAPAGFSKVFFTNGGADANENAIRMARLVTGRDKVLSGYRSYHGNTGAAVVATGDWRRVPNEYARAHVHFFGPYLYRSEFWASTPEQECDRALHHLERVLVSEGASSVAAILLETIVGTGGVLIPPPGYLAGVRAIADRYGVVLILDEVMAGFGRTGGWFAFDDHDVVPDLITFAKGVNSGYVPAGGVIISAPIASAFDDRVFPGGLTYSGHPLAMAAIVATIGAMEDEKVVENAAHIGADLLAPGLADLAERHPVIGQVRGVGVFWALELVRDRQTREPVSAATMAVVKRELMARHLLPFVADNRIHVVPPCIVSDAQVQTALAVYDEALTVVERTL